MMQQMDGIRAITDEEFKRFKKLIYEVAGINMAPEKKALVAGRLAKRLKHFGLQTYAEYYRLINSPQYPGEFQMMTDLLTTNETYFFREHQHFEFIRDEVLAGRKPDNYRVWSAASSSGEEVYTLAMVLAEILGARKWEVIGSDISTRMLESCRRAVYPMSRASHMSTECMKKYCLKGTGRQQGMLMIDKRLRTRCSFRQVNLMQPVPNIGDIDMIFIRNVMIYFDPETKKKVIERVLGPLKPGGYLFTSHSESLHGITDRVQMIKPSIYQKVER